MCLQRQWALGAHTTDDNMNAEKTNGETNLASREINDHSSSQIGGFGTNGLQ
jgi:hypothetical protein